MRTYPVCRLTLAVFVFALGIGVRIPTALAAEPGTALPAEFPARSTPSPTSTPSAPAERPSSAVENAVVKVFSTVRSPDVYKPWTKQEPTEYTGSGVVIEGKRILTNAHVLLYASQVQIQANQAGDKISAKVEAIAPGIDLAVLKLDDEKFFDSHPPLPRAASLPDIKDPVMAYGYPKGGDSLSITKGIVSRIEFTSYNYPVSGLRIQIDAAINPGNSGGPAVVGDKMVGLAFSHLSNAENIGYIIPCEEIELFLKDIASGQYHGKAAIFDDFQTLENPVLRSFLKLDSSVEGIIVYKPFSSDPKYPLKQWDVITKIGDSPVDDQGMVKLNSNVRVHFQYLVQKVANQGKVSLTLVRAGKEMHVELPVSPDRPLCIPGLKGAYPSYFIYGPLVFSDATTEFIAGYTKQAGGAQAAQSFALRFVGSPLLTEMLEKPAFNGQRLVVVSSPFFPDKLIKGYSSPMGRVLKTVNGTEIKNLEHLVQLLRDATGEFVTFEFYGYGGEDLVFRRAEIAAATDEILTDNGVRTQGSPDALAIWTAKPAK